MKHRNTIYWLSSVLLMASCAGQTSLERSEEQIIVEIDGAHLSLSDLQEALPDNMPSVDSAEYAQLHINRWVNHQLKLREAERIFSTSEHEIEQMVEAYRQSLFTKKLDQHYIETAKPAEFKHEEIEDYYERNKNLFRTQKALVKGRILRMPKDKSESSKIVALMKSNSKDKQQNLISICEKRTDYLLEDFTSEWLDFDNFISFLPLVQGDNNTKYMAKRGVQTLSDNIHTYIFEVIENRKAGDIAPFERVESTIRRILTNNYNAEVIRREEEKLNRQGEEDKLIKFYELNTGFQGKN